MTQQGSSLQNIYSKSFPSNNLFEISLVKDTNPELPFYKSKYFMFVSLTPGGQTEQGGRTFNRDGRITMKTESEKVMALANSLRAFARGQGQLGQFAIFVDSSKSGFGGGGGGYKTCFVGEFSQKAQQEGQQDKKMVALSFKSGQSKPLGVFWPPSEAIAVAEILDFLAKKGLELDFNDRHNSVGTIQQNQNQNNGQHHVEQKNQNYQQPNPVQGVVDNFGNAMNQNVTPPPQVEDLPF